MITDHFIDAGQINHAAGEPVFFEPRPENLAFIQYSSGSTGTPKGVMLTHRNLVCNASDIAERCALANTDRGLSWIPLTHDMGMIGFHLAFTWAGGSQWMMSTSLFIRRPLLWMEKSHQHAANLLYSPNFGYQYFLEALEGKPTPTWNLKSIRMIINGAEPISADICRKFTQLLAPFGLPAHCISPAYGLAEASVCVSLERFDAPIREYFLERSFLGIGNGVKSEQSPYSPEMVSFVTVGKPVTHAQLRICDVHDAVLSNHTIGQIQIRGDNVTAGYYRNEAATAAVFTPDQWLRTGDLGFLTDDGSLVITGRQKNLIILQGQNYYPHDIERNLFGLGDLSLGKVVACGLPGSSQEKEQLLLFVLFKKPLSELVPLVEAVHTRLSHTMGLVPNYVIPVREIPKTTSGKVQHYRLLERFREGCYESELESLKQLFASRLKAEWQLLDPIERTIEIKDWLQKLVASLLRYNPAELHPTVPLNDQGFKSIHSVQLRNMLEQRLDMVLSVGLLYKHPTLEKLAGFIDQALFPDSHHRPMPLPAGWTTSESLLQRAASLSDDQISQLMNEELL
jgi:acyl-CoA synthetase (AMP-forming)/AMP-acid ligase II/aryl carrier-like protein